MTNSISNSTKAIACRIPIADYIDFQKQAQSEGISMNDWLLRRVYDKKESLTGMDQFDEPFQVHHELYGNIYFDNLQALKEAFKDSLDRVLYYQKLNEAKEISNSPEDRNYSYFSPEWVTKNEESLFKALTRIARTKALEDGDISIYREIKEDLTYIWDYLFIEGCEWEVDEEHEGDNPILKLLSGLKPEQVESVVGLLINRLSEGIK